jgi:GH25 family lysozyme M1 (1,4-beta-N-acetylmuramidase)
MVLGFDGSNNNGLPKFGPAARAGYRFGWWKVSEGTYFTDHTWPAARVGMQRARIAHGGYHYAAAKHKDGAAEAAFFVARLQAKPWLLLPFLDVEEQGSEGVSAKDLEAFCLSFGKAVCDALRIDMLVLYADGNMLHNRGLDTSAMQDRYLLDYAAPGTLQPPKVGDWRVCMWQFDWHGDVPGFTGPVDRDYLAPGYTLEGLTIHAHQPPKKAARPPRANPPAC